MLLQRETIPPAYRPVVRSISRYMANFACAPLRPHGRSPSEGLVFPITGSLRRLPDCGSLLQIKVPIPVAATRALATLLGWLGRLCRASRFRLVRHLALAHR